MVSDSARFNTSGAAVGFDLALNRINREPSLLSGYDLTLSGIVDDKVCCFLHSWLNVCLQKNYLLLFFSVMDQQQCERS